MRGLHKRKIFDHADRLDERREQAGCLLELTRNGDEPITLPNGERRAFLEDGDEIILTGWSQAEGQMPIRLGECRGTLVS